MNIVKNDSIEQINKEIAFCKLCVLSKSRTNVVPGAGNIHPVILFVGEGPGRDEDVQGEPFVGAAGQLLNKMLAAIDLRREEVYIANVVKCRPPGNRNPLPIEVAACKGYLERQIAVLNPHIICTLGSVAMRAFLDTKDGITKIHGRWFVYNANMDVKVNNDIMLLPTFHPAYLLRNPNMKRAAWEDLKILKAAYDKILDGCAVSVKGAAKRVLF